MDERVAEHLADDEFSIGNYVLSGGELAAAVVIDAVARLLPGVLGNETLGRVRVVPGYRTRRGLCSTARNGRAPPISAAGRCPKCC